MLFVFVVVLEVYIISVFAQRPWKIAPSILLVQSLNLGLFMRLGMKVERSRKLTAVNKADFWPDRDPYVGRVGVE